MPEKFEVEQRWPELFAQQSRAAAWHEGRTPSREDIEPLTAAARGVIDEVAYLRHARACELRVE